MSKPIIYFASVLSCASLGRTLREQWITQAYINSRWIDMDHLESDKTPSPYQFANFWLQDEEDIQRADYVLVYGHEIDSLLGALVEAGIGIGLGKQILIVGTSKCYGTWQYHPNVLSFPDLPAVLAWLNANH